MATGGSAAQIYVQREGVTPQGGRTVAALKSTKVKTDSGLILTKHEYIEVEAGGRNQPPAVSAQRVQAIGSVVRTQRDPSPKPIQRARSDDDVPMCLVCCALLMALLSFGSILCGIPAAILACSALCSCTDDPEASRSKAARSICCSIFGIGVLIAAVIVWNTQFRD
ncbi:hypothetical protein HOLleu_03706 [Holothuria leucospilota]|uniref:Transmembrane protein n=1 Tax=Holothuria leucospilota TaxID=206669 RepID=A0A9Q1CT66_HOLLE|nr:hypothetical protein HOLleu_03706 [Holothuria leucospilota]